MFVTVLLVITVIILAAIGILLGLFGIWCIIAQKTLRSKDDF